MGIENKNILVIDDSAAIRSFIRSLLEKENCNVYEACDGEEGIDKYEKIENIDLVITDVYMPKKTGLQVVVDLEQEFKDVKIVVLSDGGAKNFSNELNVCESLGAKYFLKKDLIKDKLVDLVNKIFTEEA